MLLRFRSLALPLAGSLLFLGLLVASIPQRLNTLRGDYNIFAPPPLAQFSPGMVSILTLGNKAIYDDFINIWLLQTLLDPRKGQDDVSMMNMIRSVIKHQPKLETLYMLSCFVMVQDFKKPGYCQEITLAGLKAFPASWRLPMTQGYVEYFLLKQPAQAASFFMMAASRPDSPEYVQKTVRNLLDKNDLSPADLKRSLDIMAENENNTAFLQLLKSLGKISDDSLPNTPASSENPESP